MPDITDLRELLRQFAAGAPRRDTRRLRDLAGQDVFLYGAGNIGKRLYHLLKGSGIDISGFLDRNPAVVLPGIPVPVFVPADPLLVSRRESCTVILSGLFPFAVCNDIKTNLAALGFRNVYAIHEADFRQVNPGLIREGLIESSGELDLLGTDLPKLEHAFSLFHADADKGFFLRYLKAHLSMGTADFAHIDPPHDVTLQYLGHDIPCAKDFSRFIDCGGYDGDTYRQLTARGHEIDALAVLEPQADAYGRYVATLRAGPRPPRESFVLPCGVYSETAQLHFAHCPDAASVGKISANGDTLIQCVKLDDALHGFRPTFIKMDIEGAETAALRGATETIKDCGPQLAICVYHRLSDLWEVPNIISGIRNDYRYYLRNYNYMGLETVLYAFPIGSHTDRAASPKEH